MSIYSCLIFDVKLTLSVLCASHYFFCSNSFAFAQEIIPDSSLPNPSQVNTQGKVLIIEGGSVAGSNLFHSLERFSVLQGQQVIFEVTPTTDNIITRVTGTSPSQIDGLIRVGGNANLFLLNPNGIFFGKNAGLDIAGSFFVSTANSWEFADGKIFSATTNQSNPLLSFSVPVGVQWGKNPAAKIENAGNLVVGKNLTLMGGNITSTGLMKTVDGRLTITAQENLRLVNGANSANQVQLDAKSVELLGTDVLAKTTNRSQGLRGDIAITTGSLLVEDSLIQAVTDNNVELGKIVIQATGDVTFDFSGLSTNTGFKSAGSRGNDILLAAKNLYLNNGSALVVSTPGDSITGNIDIQVEDRIVLSNLSGIYSYVAPDIIAKGGDINIKARSLTLENGSRLSSEVDNSGSIFAYPPNSVTGRNAGDITINVSDEVKLNGRFDLFTSPVFSEISSKVGNQAVGDGGNIAINTRFLFLANQAKITAGTNGQGNAGAIAIKAESLQIKDGGQFITSSSSSGNAGDITINAHRSLIISGEDTGLFAGTTSNSSGMGGNIYVTSPVFKVLNNGFVSAKNQGWGNGGNLRFEANNLTLQQANITAETIRGRGGNIIIDSDFLSLSKNSQISATANSTGSGGNINIYSDLIVAPTTENNDITANANQGQGGNIRIFSQGIFGLKYNSELTSGNDISASSDLGVDGIVDIQALNIDPNQSDVKFPTEFLDVSQQVTQTCSVQARTNSFVIPGRSGLPLNPNEVLNNTPVWDDNRKRQGGKEQGAGGASPLKKRKRGREQGARGIVQMGIRPHPQLASPQGYESHLIEVGESERHMSGGIRLPKRAAPCSAPLHGRSQGSFPPAPFPPAPCLLLTKASAEGDTGTSPILPESLYREDYQRPLTAPFPLFEQSNTLVEAVDWTIGSDGKVKLLGSKKTVANQTLSCADGNS